jgi:DNA-binding FadR family transcriptional regulator
VALQVEPIQRRLVSEAVFEQLLSDVIAGRLAPGDGLPSERTLSEAFEVNRHAVREAIKRLQQAGLVQVAQGGATRVLDLLTSLARAARGPEQQALLRDIVEMRAVVGADVARCCAERAPDTDLQPVDQDLAFDARAEAYIEFWEAITEGAGNLAYRLALNTLVAAQRSGPIDPHIYAAEIDDPAAQRELADAVAAGDAERAQRAAETLLRRSLL